MRRASTGRSPRGILVPVALVTGVVLVAAGAWRDPGSGTLADAGVQTVPAPDTFRVLGYVPDPAQAGRTDDGSVVCPSGLLAELRHAYRWRTEIPAGLRPGDSFRAVLVGDGTSGWSVPPTGSTARSSVAGPAASPTRLRLLGAQLSTLGESVRVIEYSPAAGRPPAYYTPDGRPLFARPVGPPEGLRITSAFSSRRFHPVLHTVRAHHGVDFAVPADRIVRSVAAGRVVTLERSPGYGLMVEVRHDVHRRTRYAHLAATRPGIEPGAFVDRSTPLGLAGATGRVTAPHLHFELVVDGTRQDPFDPRTTAGDRPTAETAAFRARRDRLVALLESSGTNVAGPATARFSGEGAAARRPVPWPWSADPAEDDTSAERGRRGRSVGEARAARCVWSSPVPPAGVAWGVRRPRWYGFQPAGTGRFTDWLPSRLSD